MAYNLKKINAGPKCWLYKDLETSVLKNHRLYQLVPQQTAGYKRRAGWTRLNKKTLTQ